IAEEHRRELAPLPRRLRERPAAGEAVARLARILLAAGRADGHYQLSLERPRVRAKNRGRARPVYAIVTPACRSQYPFSAASTSDITASPSSKPASSAASVASIGAAIAISAARPIVLG